MPQIQKQKLSGSTDGRPILIVATATPGTLVHTAQTGTTVGKFDEIWIYVQNNDTVDRLVTVEFGGVTATDDIIATIPSRAGRYLMIDGGILQNGVVVRCFCAAASVVAVSGFVNSVLAV